MGPQRELRVESFSVVALVRNNQDNHAYSVAFSYAGFNDGWTKIKIYGTNSRIRKGVTRPNHLILLTKHD